MIDVERVDFVSVPTRDIARARRFYGEVLGLPAERGVCHMGFFYDPDGNVLILHRRYALPADPPGQPR